MISRLTVDHIDGYVVVEVMGGACPHLIASSLNIALLEYSIAVAVSFFDTSCRSRSCSEALELAILNAMRSCDEELGGGIPAIVVLVSVEP